VTGSYLVGDEAFKTWKDQGLKGSLVLTTSANAAVAKKGSVAYDTSKAAANHLVRELAIELAPLIRVNGVAPATVVQGSSMFPRERVIGSLSQVRDPLHGGRGHGVAGRQARAVLRGPDADEVADHPGRPGGGLFSPRVSGRLSKTTGQVLAVDGGLHEAFLR
jgi:NAD(P)-dependent dehydrogenase (short-subunit alcohol dehydrogenase family)